MKYFQQSIFIATSFILAFALSVIAAQGPRYKSLRAYSMGNAHIAVVDDKEAIYYNYAGLNQINRLGNYELRPRTGYYPHNYLDMRLNLGSAGNAETFFDAYRTARRFERIYNRAEKAADKHGLETSDVYLDSLAAHPELAKQINKFDHQLFNLLVKFDAELAFHNFGGAVWVEGNAAPYLDGGLVLPLASLDTFYIDAVIQAGGALGITNNIMVGAGLKAVKRHQVEVFSVDIGNFSNIADTLENRLDDGEEDVFEFSDIGIAADFGILWQALREVRLGVSIRDVFFNELNGERITPNLGFGINYSPRFFNRNTAYSRKMNIAMDFEDALNDERNYKVLSHLNFGMELEQVLLAWPGVNNTYRALKLRLAGGFKGGYPSFGAAVEVLRFFEIEFASWGEERGYYIGQEENRYYMLQLAIGI